MDYDKIKSLMRTYLGDIIDLSELRHLFNDDLETYYYFKSNPYSYPKKFSHLHKCVLLTKHYPMMNDYLEEYLKFYNVNEVDNVGDSALHLISIYNKFYYSERIFEILINAGINVNLQNNSGSTALHYLGYCGNYNNKEILVDLLINAGGDIYLKNKYGETP